MKLRYLVVFALAVVFFGTVFLFPTGYLVVQASTPTSVIDFIDSNEPSPNTGELFVTSVDIATNSLGTTVFSTNSFNANVLTVGEALLSEDKKMVKLNEYFSPTATDEEITTQEVQMTAQSNTVSFMVAMQYLNMSYNITGEGVVIADVTQTSFLSGLLQEGDVITSVNDELIYTLDEMVEYLSGMPLREPMFLGVERNGTLGVVGATLSSKDLGIMAYTKNESVVTEQPLSVDVTDILGSSSSLMLTLELISRLSGKDLTHGYNIAGSGTVSSTRDILAVGEISLKIISAQRAGMDYMLVPVENEIDASLYTIPIIEVKTIEDAVAALQELRR